MQLVKILNVPRRKEEEEELPIHRYQTLQFMKIKRQGCYWKLIKLSKTVVALLARYSIAKYGWQKRVNSLESTRIYTCALWSNTWRRRASMHARVFLELLWDNELSKGHKSYIEIKSNSLSSVSSLVSYILDTLLRRKLHFYRRSLSWYNVNNAK